MDSVSLFKAGIAGATGYTGLALVQLIQRHPQLAVGWLTSENSAGKLFSDVHYVPWAIPLIPLQEAYSRSEEVDVVFLCLPHGESLEAARRFAQTGVRVIDLSADFRLDTPEAYATWYGHVHADPALLARFVYGLSEINRAQIRGAQLIANPGCYPSSVNLGLHPLARAGVLGERVVIDSKSGISGAGRSSKLLYQFVESNENLTPYSLGYRHRHIAEMELVLNGSTQPGGAHRFSFNPHLLPVNQGILSTMYVRVEGGLDEAQVRALYAETYADEPFIHLIPAGQQATLRHISGTNRCAISITPENPANPNGPDYVIVACLDNMIKGASGQALQNFNIAAGIEETAGLL